MWYAIVLRWNRRKGNSIKTIYLPAIGLLLLLPRPLPRTLHRIIIALALLFLSDYYYYCCYGCYGTILYFQFLYRFYCLICECVCVCVGESECAYSPQLYIIFIWHIFHPTMHVSKIFSVDPAVAVFVVVFTFLYVHRACVSCAVSARAPPFTCLFPLCTA